MLKLIFNLLYRITGVQLFKRAAYDAYIRQLHRRGVTVGKDSQILNCMFSSTHKGDRFFIGDNCTITGVSLLAHDASPTLFIEQLQQKHDLTAPGSRRSYRKPITIGNNVFIGWGSIILPGVNIGSDVVIGAGSVVTRDIPSNSVAAGNPARVVSDIDQYIMKYRLLLERNPELF